MHERESGGERRLQFRGGELEGEEPMEGRQAESRRMTCERVQLLSSGAPFGESVSYERVRIHVVLAQSGAAYKVVSASSPLASSV